MQDKLRSSYADDSWDRDIDLEHPSSAVLLDTVCRRRTNILWICTMCWTFLTFMQGQWERSIPSPMEIAPATPLVHNGHSYNTSTSIESDSNVLSSSLNGGRPPRTFPIESSSFFLSCFSNSFGVYVNSNNFSTKSTPAKMEELCDTSPTGPYASVRRKHLLPTRIFATFGPLSKLLNRYGRLWTRMPKTVGIGSELWVTWVWTF